MNITNKLILTLAVAWILSSISTASANSTLGVAESFSVLAASTVTNTGATLLSGNLGVSPGTAITGLTDITLSGSIHQADALALQAQNDALNTYTTLETLNSTSNLTGVDLGNQTLLPGVYKYNSSAQLTGELTLNAQNLPNALYVFEIGSTLTTASNASINVINDNNGITVFWLVGSSATLGTGTDFMGSILADQSISLKTGARIWDGRVIALNGAVTLENNTISSNVPEPASLYLLLSGIGCLILCSYRNHKNPNLPLLPLFQHA